VADAKSQDSCSVNYLPNEIQRIMMMMMMVIIIVIIIIIINFIALPVPWLRQLVAVVSTRRSMYDLRPVQVEFVVNKEAL
jgi:hypothetical protein